ncbi:MAG: protease SohB [Polyangiaceae bacterium]
MDTLLEVLAFGGKALLVFLTFAACVGFLFSRVQRRRGAEPFVRLKEISERWRRNRDEIVAHLLPDPRARKEAAKRLRKGPSPSIGLSRRVFVIDFKGDVMASATDSLREEVTVVLGIASPQDEVVVRLESAGGAVHGYGLAASQLARVRTAKIPLTVCVDKVAASGGYMMACVGTRVLAAPFAILGSIGVVAPVPNLHRLLDRFGVDYEDVTAGKHKRPVSLLGEIHEEGRAKLKEQVDETHMLFKRFIHEMRPSLDVETVATGEHWYGTRAVELGLADALATSDDYLLQQAQTSRVFEVTCERPRTMRERAFSMARRAARALA